jgi:hypothetical protein
MKKIFWYLQVLLLLTCMIGCAPHYSNCPMDFPNTKWVCSNPDIWFQVDNNKQCLGEININGKITKIEVMYKQVTTDISIFPLDSTPSSPVDPVLKGEGTFSKDKMVIKLSDDKIFNNKYKELVFNKEITK